MLDRKRSVLRRLDPLHDKGQARNLLDPVNLLRLALGIDEARERATRTRRGRTT